MELNQIYNEDCLIGMQRLHTNSVQLVVTSPPYFNAREYSQYKDIADYMATMKSIFTLCHGVLEPSRMCIVNISPVLVPRKSRSEQSYRIPLPFYFVPMMEEIGFEFLEDIIWKKPEGAASNRNGGFYNHRKPVTYKPNIVTEYILVFKKKAPFLIDKVLKNNSLVLGEYERSNVWEINPETKSEHTAPFPIELPEKCIKYYSYEGETIVDPFMGSGTTAIACINTNRNYIGFEKEDRYYNIIKERIRNHTPQLKLIA